MACDKQPDQEVMKMGFLGFETVTQRIRHPF